MHAVSPGGSELRGVHPDRARDALPARPDLLGPPGTRGRPGTLFAAMQDRRGLRPGTLVRPGPRCLPGCCGGRGPRRPLRQRWRMHAWSRVRRLRSRRPALRDRLPNGARLQARPAMPADPVRDLPLPRSVCGSGACLHRARMRTATGRAEHTLPGRHQLLGAWTVRASARRELRLHLAQLPLDLAGMRLRLAAGLVQPEQRPAVQLPGQRLHLRTGLLGRCAAAGDDPQVVLRATQATRVPCSGPAQRHAVPDRGADMQLRQLRCSPRHVRERPMERAVCATTAVSAKARSRSSLRRVQVHSRLLIRSTRKRCSASNNLCRHNSTEKPAPRAVAPAIRNMTMIW